MLITFVQKKHGISVDLVAYDLLSQPHHFVLINLRWLTNARFQNFETIVEIV